MIQRLVVVAMVVVVLAMAVASGNAKGQEAPPTTCPPVENDLPCGFTDGVPVGCYDPSCDDPEPVVITAEPSPPTPAAVVYRPHFTG